METKNLKIAMITMFLFIVFTAITCRAQNFSNDPKMISVMTTESKSKEIKIKNNSKYAEVFIIYKADNTQKYWTRIGSVSVFQRTLGKFYVEPGFNYAYNLEDHRPIPIGSDTEWKVRSKDIQD